MASIWLKRPLTQPVSALVDVGQIAPQSSALSATEQFRVVSFIRHVGCPFAENTVRQLRSWTEAHPQVAVFVISHGDEFITHDWLDTIGGSGRIRIVIDTKRELHAKWGVGLSGFWHFAGPSSLLGIMALLPKGIRNRSAAGTRWQRAAIFMLDGERVIWSHVPRSAEEVDLPPGDLINFQASRRR